MCEIHEDGLGGHIQILERGDETRPTVFRMVMPKGFGPPAPERHPRQTEQFRVLRGRLDLGMVNGEHVVLDAGETFELPANTYHHPKNGGDDELEFEATLTPGLDTAPMFVQLYTETREHSGFGQFARVAMAFRRYRNSIAFKQPVPLVMRLVSAVARGLGMRPTEPVPVEAPQDQTSSSARMRVDTSPSRL